MAESTQVLAQLKKAANYSKLAFHKDGPKSYVKGQGALTKTLVKFGEDGALGADELAKTLGWPTEAVADVARIAQENGYVLVEPTDGAERVAITDKGREVVEKRFAAEDRVADEILQELSDEEKEQLAALCGKIIERCQEMGVDYSLIKKRRGKCAHRSGKPGKRCKKGTKKGAKKACKGKAPKKDKAKGDKKSKKIAKKAKKSAKKSKKRGKKSSKK